jgi:peroxiredoxin
MNIKYPLPLILTLIFFHSCNHRQSNDKNFILTGTVDGPNTEYLILHYNDSSNVRKSDTIKINGKVFYKEGNLNSTQKVAITSNLTGKYLDSNGLLFFLEANKVELTLKEGEFAKAKVNGSITQNENYDFQKTIEPLNEKEELIVNKRRKLIEKRKQSNNEDLNIEIEKLTYEGQKISDKIKNVKLKYISNNPQSYLSIDLLNIYKSFIPIDSLILLYDNLDPIIRKSSSGISIKEQIELHVVNTGDIAPRFSGEDIDGKKIKLSQFLGKTILLDFGADWCVPCKKEIPEIKRIYDDYHSVGLEIIGISFDKDKTSWKENIENEKMNWHHIYEGLNNSKKGSISKMYSVQPIPAYILIDEKGIIVDRYRGADKEDKSLNDLENKLNELLESK